MGHGVGREYGDRHMTQAKKASDRASASEQYKYAFEYYLFARFPLENSAGKVKAYDKALEAFTAYAKLQDPPIEIVRHSLSKGRKSSAYLRLPRGVRPAPLVLTIGGLDGRKENASFRSDAYSRTASATSPSICRERGNRPYAKSCPAPSANSRTSSTTSAPARSSTPSASSSTADPGAGTGPRASPTSSASASRRGRPRRAGARILRARMAEEGHRHPANTSSSSSKHAPPSTAPRPRRLLAYGPKMSLKTAGWLDKPPCARPAVSRPCEPIAANMPHLRIAHAVMTSMGGGGFVEPAGGLEGHFGP